jgi:phosphatidylserine/phosphatidylglycerophosphate/cardiolipin synthase-like enzyme
LTRLDTLAGTAVARLVSAHHRRRLTRLGHRAALDPPAGGWAASGSPPREGNTLEVLVDGATALAEIASAIEAARSWIWLAGWFFTPDFHLRGEAATLTDLLAGRSPGVDVRLIAWAGSPLPLFRPDRKEVAASLDDLRRRAGVTCAADARERPLHCHHEKVVIVDGEVAFVGGIDLTSNSGDRLDSSNHPARGSLGWHDVSSRLRGPAVEDVIEHLRGRWRAVTGESTPAPAATPERAGHTTLQIVRTVPERIYEHVPRGEFGILESYLRAIRSARRLIYLENQFLWSPEVVAALAEKLASPPDDDFRLLLLLPLHPNNGKEDTRGQLGVLAEADEGGRLLACTLHQQGEGARPVYVHAKVGIVDDRWLTVGSANLNEHSLFNDTELNVVSDDAPLARATRLRLWSEHLERPASELEGDPCALVDEVWTPLADEQHERRERGLPLTHRLVRLPATSRRSETLWGPINGLFVDG